jgi:hypothetical protein
MTTATRPQIPRFFLIMLALSALAASLILSHYTQLLMPKTPTEKLTLDEVRSAIAEAARRREEALKPDTALPQTDLAENWGIEVIGIKHAMTGYMLDFRFRVLDLNKALPLFDPRHHAYVETERSHIKLPVPIAEKIGSLRPTNRGQNIKAGKTYYILFANPDSHVKPNEKVSVVIGDFKVEHLTVR